MVLDRGKHLSNSKHRKWLSAFLIRTLQLLYVTLGLDKASFSSKFHVELDENGNETRNFSLLGHHWTIFQEGKPYKNYCCLKADKSVFGTLKHKYLGCSDCFVSPVLWELACEFTVLRQDYNFWNTLQTADIEPKDGEKENTVMLFKPGGEEIPFSLIWYSNLYPTYGSRQWQKMWLRNLAS